MGLLPKVPDMHPPKKAKGQTLMRGRPITAEEFDRMLAAAPKVRPDDSPAWTQYLTALWLSGLRLEESLVLSWDQDKPFTVDLTGRRPAFRIYAEAQKARRDEVLPMTPDLAQWLLQTPEAERSGPVFKMIGLEHGRQIAARTVGRMVSKIGKKAGVVVNKAAGKFASARLAAGFRHPLGVEGQAGGLATADASRQHRNHDGLLRGPGRGRRGRRSLGQFWGDLQQHVQQTARSDRRSGNGPRRGIDGSRYAASTCRSGGQGIRTLNPLRGI